MLFIIRSTQIRSSWNLVLVGIMWTGSINYVYIYIVSRIWVDEQNFHGSTRPVWRLLPLVTYAYLVLSCPWIIILVHVELIYLTGI